jgi:hypothetical protein
MVMEYAGEELFNYIVAKGKGGVNMMSVAVFDGADHLLEEAPRLVLGHLRD